MTLVLGVLAGLFTTTVGMGGGVLLLLTLSAWWGDPLAALAVTTPALLIGNLHRLLHYRRDLAWPIAGPFVAGALPGAFFGGLVAVMVPPWAVQAAMLVAAVGAGGRALGWWAPRARRAALLPAGAGIGAMTATTGAAGYIVGPLLLAAGLSGSAYLATMSMSSLAMHVGRLAAYGAGGLFDTDLLALSMGLAASIVAGNAIGARLRSRVSERLTARLEVAAAVGMVALAVAGLLR